VYDNADYVSYGREMPAVMFNKSKMSSAACLTGITLTFLPYSANNRIFNQQPRPKVEPQVRRGYVVLTLCMKAAAGFSSGKRLLNIPPQGGYWDLPLASSNTICILNNWSSSKNIYIANGGPKWG
jgi:hypothetical protein